MILNHLKFQWVGSLWYNHVWWFDNDLHIYIFCCLVVKRLINLHIVSKAGDGAMPFGQNAISPTIQSLRSWNFSFFHQLLKDKRYKMAHSLLDETHFILKVLCYPVKRYNNIQHNIQHKDIQYNDCIILIMLSVAFYLLLCWMSLCW